MNRMVLWLISAAALTLTGCGGGSDDAASGIDRIEPLDTSLLRLAQARGAHAAASRWPAAVAAPRVELGPLSLLKRAAGASDGGPLLLGRERVVPATADAADFASRLQWQQLDDGAQVAALAFSAEGARAMRVGADVAQLPPGARLRWYGAPGSPVIERSAAQILGWQSANATQGLGGAAAHTLWGPDTVGAVSTIEIELPPGATPAQLRLAVPRVAHLTRSVTDALTFQKDLTDVGDAGACIPDVRCRAELDAESRAVVQLIFNRDGGTWLCSGTLLNDSQASGRPFVLTAAHCIDSVASAASVEALWFFRAAACNASPAIDPAFVRDIGGAVLRSTHATIDTTLIELNNPPPANVVYAGSYFGDAAGTGLAVAAVHHPEADLQKYNLGSITGYVNCGGGYCTNASAATADMWRVLWSQGATEQGSSGSAIWAELDHGVRYVVGALHGGSSSCLSPGGPDYYGRFDRAFHAGIGSWLVR